MRLGSGRGRPDMGASGQGGLWAEGEAEARGPRTGVGVRHDRSGSRRRSPGAKPAGTPFGNRHPRLVPNQVGGQQGLNVEASKFVVSSPLSETRFATVRAADALARSSDDTVPLFADESPDHAASTQGAGAEAGKPPPLLHPAYKQPAGIEASRSLDPNSPTERFSQHYCARCQYPRIREMAEV